MTVCLETNEVSFTSPLNIPPERLVDWKKIAQLRVKETTPDLFAKKGPHGRNLKTIKLFNQALGRLAGDFGKDPEKRIIDGDIWPLLPQPADSSPPELQDEAYVVLKRLGALAFVYGIPNTGIFFAIKEGKVWKLRDEDRGTHPIICEVTYGQAAELLAHFTGPEAIPISSYYNQTDAAIEIVRKSLL